MMPFFKASSITKKYSNHLALDRVSIEIPERSIYGLLGPNGAGKTSFIRIVNQITAPDEGELYFRGEKMREKHVSLIGYLPEERGLYKKMKVGEQAIYLAQLKGLSKNDAVIKLREWFEKFDLMPWWNRKVEELSKGMQQKVQFIVTVLHEPELLIFDEPFSGFDPINVNLLKDEILRLRNNGSTVIFSTHNMASVEELCDEITLLNKSRKILDGKVKDVKKEYRTNTYELVYNGYNGHLKDILADDFEIKGEYEEDDEGLRKARIKITGKSRANDLLKILIPYISIHGFNEVLPTMNDIFIAKVREEGHK